LFTVHVYDTVRWLRDKKCTKVRNIKFTQYNLCTVSEWGTTVLVNAKKSIEESIRTLRPRKLRLHGAKRPASRRNVQWAKSPEGETSWKWKQELSYRQQIARQLRKQYVEGSYRHKCYTVTLKSRLRVTQGHWKRDHWIDHTRLSSSRVIWRWILLWP